MDRFDDAYINIFLDKKRLDDKSFTNEVHSSWSSENPVKPLRLKLDEVLVEMLYDGKGVRVEQHSFP
eukprot:2166183-Ditylum_brightwellii.AAC.1